METLKAIRARAARRKGGERALQAEMQKPKSKAALRRTKDDRYLSMMTKCVFQAGFVWRVVEYKWPGFEETFHRFDPPRVARLTEKQLAKLTRDERIIRNPQKIQATRDNARLLVALAKEHGSVGRFLANWPEDDMVGLWGLFKERGSRLGGMTGQFFLRFMGVSTLMLSGDVVKALRAQGIVEQKNPTSKGALRSIQEAVNVWREESGLSSTEISRILACSVD